MLHGVPAKEEGGYRRAASYNWRVWGRRLDCCNIGGGVQEEQRWITQVGWSGEEKEAAGVHSYGHTMQMPVKFMQNDAMVESVFVLRW